MKRFRNILLDYQNPQNGNAVVNINNGEINIFSTELNKNLDEIDQEVSVHVLFDDSLCYRNQQIKSASVGEYYEKFNNVLRYLNNATYVKQISVFVISFSSYIDPTILKTVNESEKTQIYHYGTTDNVTDTTHIYTKSYQDFNVGEEGTYTDYDNVLVHNYNWFIDFKNEFEVYREQKILFILEPVIANILTAKQRDFLNTDTWTSISTRKELNAVIDWYKDEFEDATPMFDKCVYVSNNTSEAFRSALFLDILSMSDDGISTDFDIASLHYDIIDSAYSYYEYRGEDNTSEKKEEEIMTTRFKEGLHNKNIIFHIPDVDFTKSFSLDLINKIYPNIEGQEEFNPRDYINGNVEILPTHFNMDVLDRG